MLRRISLALVAATALGGQALAYEPFGRDILSELPANAPPGECYARVRVPGEPMMAPPGMQGGRWIQQAGPPGSPGPIWCLIPTGPGPVMFEGPARFGFIRVLCDDDITADRIGRVQHQLQQRGYYRGGVTGRYDAATAAALSQFQTGAHIAHGGYLSIETLRALEGGGLYGAPVYDSQAYAAARAYSASSYSSASYGDGYGYGYAQQGYAPAYPAAPSPCVNPCAPPPPLPCNPCAYQQGYSYGAAYHSTPGYLPPPAYAVRPPYGW